MPKGTKKTVAPADEMEKKNALLDADDESADESSSEDESADESKVEEQVEKAPVAASKEAAPVAVAPKVNTDTALMTDIQRTKAILDAEPKVQFMIPLNEGEKPGSVHQCFINGYMVPVKKGVMTLIPQTVAQLLADHYRITSEAGTPFRLDLQQDKQDALA